MIPVDAIILGAGPQRFSEHLEIIRPLKLVKNARFLHILPIISAVCYFLAFYTQVQFWRTSGHQIEMILVVPESRHRNLSNELS